MAKQTYTVTSPIRHNGEHYAEGDSIELEQQEAEALLTSKSLLAIDATALPDNAQRINTIVDAINTLDTNNAEHWTTSGKPQVSAIETITGFSLTNIERDAACKQLAANS